MADRFELLEEVGVGGMGAVWKARASESGEIVALKLLHRQFVADAEYVARFEREVEIAQRVDSPYVVKVLGFGRQDGAPYVAMEYIDGRSLKDSIRQGGPLSWEGEGRRIAIEMTRGLAAAHAAGVVHRDVKPSNILLDQDGSVHLADFGIARAADFTRLTGNVTVLGTPAYMAPDRTVDERSDLYALGCVLFEMVTGEPPFVGETQQQVLLQHMRDAPDLSRLPSNVRRIVGWLLEKEAGKRPASAVALLGVLEGSTSVPSGGLPGRLALGRPRRWIAAGALGVAGIGIAGMAAAMLGGGEEPPVDGDDGDPTSTVTSPATVVTPTAAAATPPPATTSATSEPTATPPGTPSPTPTLPRSPTSTAPPTASPTPAAVPPTATSTPQPTPDPADWCPDLPGSWLSGCPEPEPPFLGYAITSPSSFRLILDAIPYATKAQPFMRVALDDRVILTSGRPFSPGDESWYTDIYDYFDPSGAKKTIEPDTEYCVQVTLVYPEGRMIQTERKCLRTLPR